MIDLTGVYQKFLIFAAAIRLASKFKAFKLDFLDVLSVLAFSSVKKVSVVSTGFSLGCLHMAGGGGGKALME